jgi:hypothetical protein
VYVSAVLLIAMPTLIHHTKQRLHGISMLLALVCVVVPPATAQRSAKLCEAIVPFTDSAVSDIRDVFQFTFLHYPPQNRFDTLVYQLNYPNYVLDSSYFAWPAEGKKVLSTIDIFNCPKLLRDIAKYKNAEAFTILYLPFIFKTNSYLREMHVADDLSPFNHMIAAVEYFDATKLLNEFFLENAVDTRLPRTKFDGRVLALCEKQRPRLLKDLQYCKPLKGDAYSLAAMQQIDASACDSAILPIIRSHLNKYPSQKSLYRLDSIMLDIFQLPLVQDAQDDACTRDKARKQGADTTSIGVIYDAGKEFMTEQKLFVLRVYTLVNDSVNGQRIASVDYSNNFISKTRQACEGKE